MVGKSEASFRLQNYEGNEEIDWSKPPLRNSVSTPIRARRKGTHNWGMGAERQKTHQILLNNQKGNEIVEPLTQTFGNASERGVKGFDGGKKLKAVRKHVEKTQNECSNCVFGIGLR